MRIKYNCKYCKKEFVNFDWRKSIYCSRSCRTTDLTYRGNMAKNWKGDKIGYNSLHKWIRDNFKKPQRCAHCYMTGKKGKRNWNIDWANKSGKYTRDNSDWIGLCRKCHIAYDSIVKDKKTISLGNHKVIFNHEL